MSETVERAIRHQYRLGPQGHISIGWDEDDDERVIPMMQRLIDSGHEIWIVKRNPMREERLQRVTELENNRHAILRDPELKELFHAGIIGLLDEEAEEPLTQERRATSAADAAANDSVVHRPARGG